MWDFEKNLKEAKDTLKLVEFPIQIILETVAGCNLKCPACPTHLLQRKKGIIQKDLIEKIFKEVSKETPEITEIYPAYMGEPLAYKGLFELIDSAKNHGIKKVYLNTNATLLDEKRRENLIKSPPARMIMSLDGFSPEIYEARRLGANHKIVYDNVIKMIQDNDDAGRPIDIWVQMILDEESAKEEDAFKDFWLDKGVVVKTRSQLTWGGSVGANYLHTTQLDRIPCPWIMRQIVVAYNGEVVQCDADYEAGMGIGNIYKQSIKEIWLDHFRKLQERHMNGNYSDPMCAECHDWKVGKSRTYRPQ